jgi:class 3 adenylate cyclase
MFMTKAGSFEGESSTDGIASGNVEELIKLRVQLDEELQNRFTKKMAVLFTDVEGSSAFFTTHGDVAGRIMLEKHNNLLFPIIEDHQGVIIKTIGDSIMASFNDPKMALKSAVVMQRKLVSYNQDRPRKSQIHIRISINFGDIIVEDNDIFGNVVNVTSRILSIAKPDHILISQTIYSVMIGTEGFAFRPISKVASLKGSEQITVYEVLWREDASAHESLSLMSLRVVNDGHDLEEGKVSTDKWAEGCFDLVIPILYRHTSRLDYRSVNNVTFKLRLPHPFCNAI